MTVSTYSLEESLTGTSRMNAIGKAVKKLPALDLLISTAITLPISSTVGLERAYQDGAIFLYVGQMWRQGFIPYLQVFDNKPPGIFLLTAIASITPHAFWLLAFMEFLFAMGCVLAVRKTLGMALAPPQTVFFGTIATALIVNLRFYGTGNTPESYMLAPMAASMLVFAYSLQSGKLRHVFFAGVCSGLACMFKPFALSVFMAQIVFAACKRTPTARHALLSVLANLAGALSAWAPIFIYFAGHHALKPMLDASFFYNIHYGVAAQPKALVLFTELPATLLPLSTLIGCVLMGLVALRKLPSRKPSARGDLWSLTLLWFAFSLALVLLAGRGYRHYFLSLMPSLGLAAGLVFWSLEEHEPNKGLRLAVCALLLSPVLMTDITGFALVIHDYEDLALRRPIETPVDVAAAQLQRIAAPSSTVFVWGFEPSIFSSTHLRNAFRFPTSQYIYDSPRSYEEVGQEVLTGMKTTPPDYVVLTPQAYFATASRHSELVRDPVQDEFMAIVHKGYTKVWEQNSFGLYRRNQDFGREKM